MAAAPRGLGYDARVSDDDVEPRYWFELPVRYADTDAQGHVYFANYLTFFDEAFTGYLHAIGCAPKALLAAGVDVVYRDAQCEYLGRSRFEDRLAIGVRMERIGSTSFTTAYVARIGDALVARGRLTNVCVDARSMNKVAVPDMLRDAVARYG
jgi:acyl-CoA thioester hydrolase